MIIPLVNYNLGVANFSGNGTSSGNIALEGFKCTGSEARLNDCPKASNCTDRRKVGIKCSCKGLVYLRAARLFLSIDRGGIITHNVIHHVFL